MSSPGSHRLGPARFAGTGLLAAVAGQLGPAVTGIPGVTRRLPPRPGNGGLRIALTFDDGPDPAGTAAVLDRLRRARVRATFFVVGEQLARRPDLARRMAGAGHELAVHGWDHRPLPLVAPGATARGLARTAELVHALTGTEPRRFRPPYGVATGAALLTARRLGLSTTWWTGWGRDWSRRATRTSIAGRLEASLRSGRNVWLLHDSDRYASPGSWRTTVLALDDLLARWSGTGLLLDPDQW